MGSPRSADERAAIDTVLDDFHLAASEPDEERYFGHLAEDAVFLGTDATERWSKQAFREYAHTRMSTGTGWTYHCFERHVTLSPAGDAAWFDERLTNAKYGEVRGSGALRRQGGRWRITQYNLAFPVPNELAPRLVELIRAGDGG